MPAPDIWEWVGRLFLAGVLGALVGAERELRGHPAGIRTQALVAVASALFTGVGATAFTGPAADPTRVAAAVAAGMGFIGAGVILQYRGSIRGLTTAATLWLSAALGMAVGVGAIVPALLAAAAGMILIYGLTYLKPLIRQQGVVTVVVDYEQGHGTMGPLLQAVRSVGGDVQDLLIEDDDPGGELPTLRHVRIQVATRDEEDLELRLEELARRPEVVGFRITNS